MITRNPMEVCIFGVLALSSSQSVFGDLPASLSRSPHVGKLAALMLFVGCIIALGGIFWRDRDDGLIIEQFGLACTSFGCIIYASALYLANTSNFNNGALAFGMSLGIGIACSVRFWQIQRYVSKRQKQARELEDNKELQ